MGEPESIWELFQEISLTQRWSDFEWFKCRLIAPDLTKERITLQELEQLASEASEASAKPEFGSAKGLLTIVEEDDEHLKDFDDE